MSAVPPGDGQAKGDERPRARQFRKASSGPRLSREQSRRQNDVLHSAWRHFGVSGPMIVFLNAQNDRLEGGQPLHLALESEDGLQRVERLLGEMTYRA
ncbi:MAG TPA: antitoxin Xre/MbcA/ParS toxin-binding domain-containing protein [Sphingomicrobium sp.]|nr:antitoxin Xre/MbcA/ParS toxin-binding domain-containing protein [Sphingomicrobium sp.]